jgi:hypothetical protein
MIAQEKLTDALYALNAVLVRARTMAFEREPHETLARVLDEAELLPMLIARKDDKTIQFRAHLEELIRIDAGFAHALQRFDGQHSLPR